MLNNSYFTFLVTLIRVGLQGLYFLFLPKFISADVTVAIFLLFSLSAILPSIAAFGSQFFLIKFYVEDSVNDIKKSNFIYVVGFFALLLLCFLTARIYAFGKTNLPFLPISIYILASYIRIHSDCIMQSKGKFNITQLYYCIFWLFKIVITIIISTEPAENQLIYICLTELCLSLPWMFSFMKALIKIGLDYNCLSLFKQGTVMIGASLARGLWLEIDKLILPLLVQQKVYLEYSLVSRVFSAASVIIVSQVAKLTPDIIKSSSKDLNGVIKESYKTTFLSIVAMLCGGLITLYIYPSIGSTAPVSVALFSICLSVFMVSTVKMDYIFYNVSPLNRLMVNIVGCVTMIVFVIFSSHNPLMVIPLGFIVSFIVTGCISGRIIHNHGREA